MESYRYQIKGNEEYTSFLSFLTEQGINFSSSFHHDGLTEDRFFVTVYFNKEDARQGITAIATYLEKSHTTIVWSEPVMNKYGDAQAAVDDLYADTETLRLFLVDLLDTQHSLNAANASESEKARKEIERLTAEVKKYKDDWEFYRDCYYKKSRDNDRIRKQIQALNVLLSSIFPKED